MKELYLKLKTTIVPLSPYFWPLFTAVLGIAIPFLFLNVMVGINNKIPKITTAHHQDTVYVKLVNMTAQSLQEKIPTQQNNTVSLRPDSSIGNSAAINNEPKNLNKLPVKPVKLNPSTTTYAAGKSWLIWLIPFVLFGLWIVRNLLVKINPYYEKEKDPEELKNLLDSFSNEVNALGTPRKIKRFTNNLRFQYYILSGRKVITQQNAKLFITLLLHIEKTDLMPKLSADEEIKETPFNLFRKSIAINVPQKEEALLRELYILNRGNLV